ncbi:MAG: hypothetical protein HYR56_20825 [Acidobacteria bacterium]|nr:hypothetical protein [Acidobacteriota bacterium]MBI3425104.1 hypothetical protein [Acidobacteriota bacterium]
MKQQQKFERATQAKQTRQLLKTACLWVACLALGGVSVLAQSLEDFGYRKMGNVKGLRPLLLIIAHYDGGAPFASDKDKSYYSSLVFSLQSRDRSVSNYFLAISNGRFSWRVGGVVEVNLSVADAFVQGGEGTDIARSNRAILKAMQDGFNFAQFDANGDRFVDSSELGVLIIQNARRPNDGVPDTAYNRPTGCLRAGNSSVSFCGQAANIEQSASLMSITHELNHQLGALDLYGGGGLNNDLTLMGATVYTNYDDKRSYYLDPWHRLQLGWVEPRIRDLRAPGTEFLHAQQSFRPDAPVILYDSARGVGEFFIVEYRSRRAPGNTNFDSEVASEGVAIWHIQQDGNKVPTILENPHEWAVFHAGAPDLTRGGNLLWKSGELTPALQWLDESSSPARIFVPPFINGASTISFSWVHWTEAGGEVFQNQGTLYREPQQQQFEQVPGRLKQIEVGQGFNSFIWGINAQNEVFRYDWETQTYTQFYWPLTQIAVDTTGREAWGINPWQEVLRFNSDTQEFELVPGRLLAQISISNGNVWGLNAQQEIFVFKRETGEFQQVPGRLVQIAVGYNSVWGLNASGEIFQFNPVAREFQQVPGRLAQISVSKFQDGAVWGLNANNEIFALNGATMRFAQVPGRLVKLAVGRAGSVWGLNAAHEVFWFNPATTRFQQMPGELASLSVGLDGFVMGINSK